MLNITNNRINSKIDSSKYESLVRVESKSTGKKLRRSLIIALITLVIVLALPWTQNIQGGGKVIALKPDQRPQYISHCFQ